MAPQINSTICNKVQGVAPQINGTVRRREAERVPGQPEEALLAIMGIPPRVNNLFF